jgi:hypothetical protein
MDSSRSSSPVSTDSIDSTDSTDSNVEYDWLYYARKEHRRLQKISHFQGERLRILFTQSSDPLLLPHPLIAKQH